MKKYITYTQLTLSMLFWGCSFVWTTIVYKTYNPLTTVLLRLVLSSSILIPLLFIRRVNLKAIVKDWKIFAAIAFFEPFLYFMGESFGVKYTSPTVSAVVISTIPLITPFFAYFFLKEKITLMNFTGLVISFIGIMLVILNKDLSFSAEPKGLAFLFFAVFSSMGYGVFIKPLSEKYDTLSIITIQNAIGILYFSPFFISLEFSHFIKAVPSSETFLSLILLSTFSSVLAFFLFIKAYKVIGLVKANSFTNMIPVFTAIFAFILVGEMFSLRKSFGIILVIAGLFLSQIKKFSKNMDATENI